MFAPCNMPLHQLVERAQQELERGKARRRDAMSRAKLHPDRAAYYDRYERALLECVKKLKAIEDTHPELLELEPQP